VVLGAYCEGRAEGLPVCGVAISKYGISFYGQNIGQGLGDIRDLSTTHNILQFTDILALFSGHKCEGRLTIKLPQQWAGACHSSRATLTMCLEWWEGQPN
jgi:hypothetical protein